MRSRILLIAEGNNARVTLAMTTEGDSGAGKRAFRHATKQALTRELPDR